MNFFSNFSVKRSYNSGNVAKNRLQQMLFQDRVKIPPTMMDAIHSDLVLATSKFMAINSNKIDLSFTRTAGQDRLIVNLPIWPGKRALY
jgi:cell division topological specificity factor